MIIYLVGIIIIDEGVIDTANGPVPAAEVNEVELNISFRHLACCIVNKLYI